MSDIDPSKLKVTELKEELKKRGLDTKGVKAQLVKRLEQALRNSLGDYENDDTETSEPADTLQADVSAVDSSLDTSAAENAPGNHGFVPQHDEEQFGDGNSSDRTVESEPAEAVEATVDEQLEEPEKTADLNVVTAAVIPATSPVKGLAVAASPEKAALTSTPAAVVLPEVQVNTAAPIISSPQKDLPSPQKSPQKDLVSPQKDLPVAKPTPEKIHPVSSPVKTVLESSAPVEAPAEVVSSETVPQIEIEQQPAGDQQVETSMETEEEKPETDADVKAESEAADVKAESEAADVKAESEAADVKHSEESEERRSHRKRSRSPSEEKHKSRRSRSRSPRRNRRSSRSRSRSRSNDRHRQRRSRSQERRRSPEKAAKTEPEESTEWLSATDVQLDRYNSDLSLVITESGFKAQPLTADGFAFMWTGAKATYGVKSGKVCFETKVLSHLNADHLPPEEENRHVLRIGFSAGSASIQLGEEKLSFGYGGTGKASTDCKFTDYGRAFAAGDVVTSYVDFTNDPVEISFAVNGTHLGKCFDIPQSDLGDEALFPHILSKNCEFEVNFGQQEEPFFATEEGFVFINNIPLEERVRGPLPPAKKEECEMLMMCGLPGCGKTTWVNKYVAANPEKLYNVLGTNSIIDKMKVMGLPRKRNYHGRWDVLIDLSTKCLNKLLEIAAKKIRNYILDQTNVYPSAQRRKMRPFEGFQRKAVVIVPSDEEFKRRCEQREKEEGKEIPDSAVLEMKANFQLPEEGPIFDKVEYIELSHEEAKPVVEQYNKEGKAAQPPETKRFRGNDRDRYSSGGRSFGGRFDRGNDFQRPYRGGYNDRRGGGGGYYNRDRDSGYSSRGGGYNDRRGGRGGYSSSYGQQDRRSDQYGSSSGSGGSYKDRRDNRGSGQTSSWSSGGGAGRGGGSGWKSFGSSSGGSGTGSSSQSQSGGWKSQGYQQQSGWGQQTTPAATGYGAQSGWGNQDWSQQSYQQQQPQQGSWGQWSAGYGQQQTQPQQAAGQWSGQNYSYTGWNQAAASASWPTYGTQQTWDYNSGQYQK